MNQIAAKIPDSPNPIEAVLALRLTQIPPKPTSRWNPDTSAAKLIQDLVSVSNAKSITFEEDLLLAKFENVSTAIFAARRIQWALEGHTSRSDQPVSASIATIVIDTEPNWSTGTESLLRDSMTGQMLLTAPACHRLESLPGLPLGPALDSGLRQILWVPSSSASLHSAELPAPRWLIPSGPPPTPATTIKQSILNSPPVTLPPLQSTTGDRIKIIPEPRISHIAVPVQSFSSSESALPADTAIQTSTTGETKWKFDNDPSPAPTTYADSEPEPQPRPRKPWLLAGAAAAAIMVAAGAYYALRPAPSKPVANPTTTTNSSPNPTVPDPSPDTNQPTSAAAVLTKGTSRPTAEAKKPAHNPTLQGSSSSESGVNPTKPKGTPIKGCDLNPTQYQSATNVAWSNYKRGNYSLARTGFLTVLACEPHNTDAANGLYLSQSYLSRQEPEPEQ